MGILLDDEEIENLLGIVFCQEYSGHIAEWKAVIEATGKKILIELQTIYNLPDEGMFHEKMGEFIQELTEEVK